MRGRVGNTAPCRTLSPAVAVLHGNRLDVRDDRPSPWRPHPFVAVAIVLGTLVFLLDLTPLVVVVLALATVLGVQATVAAHRGRRLAEELSRPPSVGQIACAVADALLDAGLSPLGSAGVRVQVDEDGGSRCAIDGVDPLVEATFATALDEVLSPMLAPRYVVPRWVLHSPVDNAGGVRVALGRVRPDAQVWHSVPAVLGTDDRRAQAFARAWDHWVGGGPALDTGSLEGRDVLVTHRGRDPLAGPRVG